ncbi:MAG TPA: hypothetical protein VEA99_20255 [Gemmatimonadaceae bacterium]|nr:hypothetical protein [Gemmatimonadaceae bacterium]
MRRALVVADHHLRAGTRAALRASAVAVAGVIFVLGSAPDPGYTFLQLVLGSVGTRPGLGPRAWIAIGALGFAATAARRVTLGVATWMRSLPASADDTRRGAWLACTVATLPLAVYLIGAVALALAVARAPLSPARLATLPLVLLAGSAAALQVQRPAARLAAAAALVASAHGSWLGLVASAALLLAWDRTAGGVRPAPLARARTSTRVSRARGDAHARLRAGLLASRWIARVLGARAIGEALVLAAIPVAFAALVRANNPELGEAARLRAARLGADVAIALAAASLAGPLLARRPPWPWARTLPWSAAERLTIDAGTLVVPLVVVGAAAWLVALLDGTAHPTLVVCALATVACAATSAAAALRVGAHRQTGAVGEATLVALPAAMLFGVWPITAWVAPALVAALLALGARRERLATDAVRWNELRHGIDGDQGWLGRA